MPRSKESKIVVVGSTMIDMISYVDRVPAAGETLRGHSFALGFGGKGANQAVMAALLGAQVWMVNCLGDDMFGEPTLENFRGFGVDTRYVRKLPGRSSGVAPIWVEEGGANRIIIVPGANEDVTPSLVDDAFDNVPSPEVVLCQLEIPQPTICRAFERGQACGAVNILNPAPAGEIDPGIIERSSWLIPNEVEFSAIAHGFGVSVEHGIGVAVQEFCRIVGTNVVVTLGADGALLGMGSGDERCIAIAAEPVKAVDTTGAGDAFVGAFAYAIARGLQPAKAVAFGCDCAALSVRRPGTQSSFPRGEELAQLRHQALAEQVEMT